MEVPHLDTMEFANQRLDLASRFILAAAVDEGAVCLQHKVGGL